MRSRGLTNRANNEFNDQLVSVCPLVTCTHMDGPTERAKTVTKNYGISFQSQGREQLTGYRQDVFNFLRTTQSEPLYVLTVTI